MRRKRVPPGSMIVVVFWILFLVSRNATADMMSLRLLAFLRPFQCRHWISERFWDVIFIDVERCGFRRATVTFEASGGRVPINSIIFYFEI